MFYVKIECSRYVYIIFFFDPLFTNLFQSSNSLPGRMVPEEGFFWDTNTMVVTWTGMTKCHFFSTSFLPFGFFKAF